MGVLEFLKNKADQFADKIALVDAKNKITYLQLFQEVNVLKQKLQGVFVTKSVVVRIDVKKDIQSIILFLGLLASKITVLPAAHNESIDFPYTDGLSFIPLLGSESFCLCFGFQLFHTADVTLNSPLPSYIFGGKYINSTSGSSGAKKYCISDWEKILSNTAAVCREYEITADCVWLSLFPAHMHIFESFMRGIFAGGESVLLENHEIAKIADFIYQEQITHIQGTAYQLRNITHKLNKEQALSVKTIECTGSALSSTTMGFIRNVFMQTLIVCAWGSAETTGVCISSYRSNYQSEYNIGRIISTYEFRLDHFEGATNCYLLSLKGQAMIDAVWSKGKLNKLGEWYNTGDIVEIDSEHNLYFKGRASGMIKCGGENIYPEELESIIGKINGVKDVIVFGIYDDIRGEIPVALIQSGESFVDEGYIKRNALTLGLELKKMPKRIKIISDDLPYKASDKKDLQKAKLLIC